MSDKHASKYNAEVHAYAEPEKPTTSKNATRIRPTSGPTASSASTCSTTQPAERVPTTSSDDTSILGTTAPTASSGVSETGDDGLQFRAPAAGVDGATDADADEGSDGLETSTVARDDAAASAAAGEGGPDTSASNSTITTPTTPSPAATCIAPPRPAELWVPTVAYPVH